MAETPVLEAVARAGVGKGAARSARREGYVPGVIYGGGEAPPVALGPLGRGVQIDRRAHLHQHLLHDADVGLGREGLATLVSTLRLGRPAELHLAFE